jgi:hypothetical protein
VRAHAREGAEPERESARMARACAGCKDRERVCTGVRGWVACYPMRRRSSLVKDLSSLVKVLSLAIDEQGGGREVV